MTFQGEVGMCRWSRNLKNQCKSAIKKELIINNVHSHQEKHTEVRFSENHSEKTHIYFEKTSPNRNNPQPAQSRHGSAKIQRSYVIVSVLSASLQITDDIFFNCLLFLTSFALIIN